MKIEEARCFVQQFCNKEYSRSDHESFLTWVREASIDELNSMADILEASSFDNCEFALPSDQWIANLESKIDKSERQYLIGRPFSGYALTRKSKFVLAVSLPVILGIVWLMMSQLPSNGTGTSYTLVSTEIGQHRYVKLSDGTSVWLNGGSRLRYLNKAPGETRQVELTGEAFFDVPCKSHHPFVVVSGEIKVEVLGTAFNVRNYPRDCEISINVTNGKIKAISRTGETIVNADQQAKLVKDDSETHSFVVGTIDNATPLTMWREGMVHFTNENLDAVLKELSFSFGFDYTASNISSESRLTGTFDMNETIDEICERLRFVFKDAKFQYDKRGKRVLVLKTR